MRLLCTLLVVALLACLVHDAMGKHHKLAKLVLKKAFKKIRKNPIIPLVIPLPIIKHQPKPVVHHEIINVHEPPKIIHKPIFIKEESHGWDAGWENKW